MRRMAIISGAVASVVATVGLAVVFSAEAAAPGYEAEKAGTLAGGARVASCDKCSGGQKVGWIGRGATIEFTGISSELDGNAILTVAYASNERRTAQLTVNGMPGPALTFAGTGGWNTPGTMSTQVTLKKGTNSIGFGNSTGWAPDVDGITVVFEGPPPPTGSPSPPPPVDPSPTPGPTKPPGACPEWSSAVTYKVGDVVSQDGRTFTATVDHTLAPGVSWAPATTAELWSAGGVCAGAIPGHAPKFPAPPQQWKEHWFEHKENLALIAYNDTVAIYFDAAVNRNAGKWMMPYLTKMWAYTQKTYGANTKLVADRLYSIHHEGTYSGGHPSTVYDASHDFRNVSDVGGRNWTTPQYEVVTHEAGHVVEATAAGKHGSPAFGLWKDSKWMEFFIYDVYVNLGMTKQAADFGAKVTNTTDSFPRAGTRWYRDWFGPLWRDHGKAEVMARYFRLLGQHYPNNGTRFTRNLNWGEFVHFMSGAAGTDLRPLATTAFGWPAEYEAQFQQARKAFPGVTY